MLRLTTPPSPYSALATISLLPPRKATKKLVSIVKLPPLALLKASAEIRLLLRKSKVREMYGYIFRSQIYLRLY